jgi:hypothetical protein
MHELSKNADRLKVGTPAKVIASLGMPLGIENASGQSRKRHHMTRLTECG